jgi:YfiH family protein
MDERQILGILGEAHRFAAGKTAPSLVNISISHGFFGRDDAPPAVHYLKQVHGTTVLQPAAGAPGIRGDGDGIAAVTPGMAIAVRTADCLPILIADRQRRMALAIHAGWRGLTAGIVPAAVAHASRSGIEPRDLVAAVGPAIGRARFEVGPEVVEALMSSRSGMTPGAAAWCISKGRADRWHVDLATAALLAMAGQGIPAANLAAMLTCTYDDARWYSYRREGQGVGSNWAWIQL